MKLDGVARRRLEVVQSSVFLGDPTFWGFQADAKVEVEQTKSKRTPRIAVSYTGNRKGVPNEKKKRADPGNHCYR